jgi:hypothetical protein
VIKTSAFDAIDFLLGSINLYDVVTAQLVMFSPTPWPNLDGTGTGSVTMDYYITACKGLHMQLDESRNIVEAG